MSELLDIPTVAVCLGLRVEDDADDVLPLCLACARRTPPNKAPVHIVVIEPLAEHDSCGEWTCSNAR